MCVPVYPSICKITHKRTCGCRPNVVGSGKSDPLEVIKF